MAIILENSNQSFERKQNPAANRIEALKTLTKLLLHEVELLEEISPFKNFQNPDGTISLTDKVQRYEASLICNALLSANGNQRRAAKILGMKTTTLHAKIKRYEIDSFNLRGQLSTNGVLEEST